MQSLHQILIVQRSKPVLSYTRSHRVPFDTSRIDPFDRPVDTPYTMAGSTKDQSILAPLQDSAPPDKTAIIAQLTRMNKKMDAIQLAFDAFVESFERRFASITTQLATQQSTPPALQEAKKEKANDEENAEIIAEKQEQQPLYQATVEDITESITESTTKDGNSMAVSKSTLSTIPRLCTTPTSRDSAACLSNALLFAFHHTGFLNTTIPGHIQHSEGMEATGQG